MLQSESDTARDAHDMIEALSNVAPMPTSGVDPPGAEPVENDVGGFGGSDSLGGSGDVTAEDAAALADL